jgi:hypothetical protein
MKKINLNSAGLKNFFEKFAKNLRLVFFAVFLLMLVLEAFQVKNSVSIIFNVNQAPPVQVTGQQVRINFDNYNKAVERIQQAAVFEPTGGITNNPFNPSQTLPKPTPAASSTPAQSGK